MFNIIEQTCCNIKHHGYIRLRPGKLYIQLPVLTGYSVLQRTLVEEVRWELTELRMHSILNLETERTDSKNNKTLKQGLTAKKC